MQFLMGLNDSYSTVRSNILMMSPLPNVRQAYSLVIQEETQRQMTSETTENFSIAAAIHTHQNNFSNKLVKDKRCEHCNREGHTIDNCRTLKFHCSFCNKKGHTEDRCRFKNGTWGSSNMGNQSSNANQSQQRQHGPRSAASRSSPAANAAESSQSALELSAEQIQQLARALSMISSNNNAGNNNTHANAAGLGYGEDDWLG
ncbi:putative transcription factor interactor and regulator CCHC(Zn) family [Medicago truncatula]|uniref:Putative transcription factor interactor and regulator CCHC(Zn) family n=1 Tax=Medicago truncatula TaxID=3880 RepID=A0A396JF70_MEDTR|nr:putative transcription factor interactor and regulator CCHC(Zn) family [Medicago truncatula]